MSRAKLVIMVAVAILFAQLHCVVACATVPGDTQQSLPPCHQHHNHPSSSCTHQIIISPALPTPMFAAAVFTPVITAVVPAFVRISPVDSLVLSPPESSQHFSTNLRI